MILEVSAGGKQKAMKKCKKTEEGDLCSPSKKESLCPCGEIASTPRRGRDKGAASQVRPGPRRKKHPQNNCYKTKKDGSVDGLFPVYRARQSGYTKAETANAMQKLHR